MIAVSREEGRLCPEVDATSNDICVTELLTILPSLRRRAVAVAIVSVVSPGVDLPSREPVHHNLRPRKADRYLTVALVSKMGDSEAKSHITCLFLCLAR